MTTQKRATKLALIISTAILVAVVVVVGVLLVLNNNDTLADPYEAAWDNCIAMAEADPPADDEFPIPPDQLCEIHENDVGRDQFIIDFGE